MSCLETLPAGLVQILDESTTGQHLPECNMQVPATRRQTKSSEVLVLGVLWQMTIAHLLNLGYMMYFVDVHKFALALYQASVCIQTCCSAQRVQSISLSCFLPSRFDTVFITLAFYI